MACACGFAGQHTGSSEHVAQHREAVLSGAITTKREVRERVASLIDEENARALRHARRFG